MTDLERMELAVRRVVEFMGRQTYTPSGEEMFKALGKELEKMNTEPTPPRGTGEG